MELLIVVVVIAILATITVVAYTGVSNNARVTALQSDLSQQAKSLALWKTRNQERYPADLSAAQAAGLLRDSGNATYTTYIVNNTTNPANFCATAERDGLKYSVASSAGDVRPGECVTNIARNPDAVSVTGFGGAGTSGATSIVNGDAFAGTSFARRTFSASGSTGGLYYGGAAGTQVIAGVTYSGTAWVRASKPVTITPRFEWANSAATAAGPSAVGASVPVGTSWTRIDIQGLAPATAVSVAFSFYSTSGWAIGDYEDADAIMIVEGSTFYSFSGIESWGWFWNGTPNNSTSTGPAVAL